jgi:hypothetical protein
MSRLIAIVATLLAGLIGLFMSVCGGGFFITMSYSAIRTLFSSGPRADISIVILLVFAAACAAGGIMIIRICWNSIRRIMGQPKDGD